MPCGAVAFLAWRARWRGGTAALKGVGLAQLQGRLFHTGTAVILLAVAGLPGLRDVLLPPRPPATLCKCTAGEFFWACKYFHLCVVLSVTAGKKDNF